MSNYPDGFPIDSLEAREAFQGDVSRRVVEITVEVEASMLNHKTIIHGDLSVMWAWIGAEAAKALRKSWEDEKEEKDEDDDTDDMEEWDRHPDSGEAGGG